MTKQHKGTISSWTLRTSYPGNHSNTHPFVIGWCVGHPTQGDFWIATSYMIDIKQVEGVTILETENSFYTLNGPNIGYDEYAKRRTKWLRDRTGEV
jgi:hypothetical protein